MVKSLNNVVDFCIDLIKFNTITPNDNGILDFMQNKAESIGCTADVQFFGEGDKRTGNIYIKYGFGSKNLCFLGHLDVVPPGDVKQWKHDPFTGIVENDTLYGRGVVDMKGGVAAFFCALKDFIANHEFDGAISMLLTCDEEGTGEFGAVKMLEYISSSGEKIDGCIIGEPTSSENIGDCIKVGRRGSVNFKIDILGKQGHVAYKDMIDNPITKFAKICNVLKSYKFDDGNKYFEATNLEFVDCETDNLQKVQNVVPSVVRAMLNVRYNNLHSGESVVNIVKNLLKNEFNESDYRLSYKVGNESFLFGETEIGNIAINAIKDAKYCNEIVSNCTGGTTDGRHIINYCKNTVEVGLNEYMAHKIDEYAKIDDLRKLQKIYYNMLRSYFKIQE